MEYYMRKLFRLLYIKDIAFYKQVIAIAIPIALQTLITTGVNMMDTLMLGMVGETELSAVSLANQFIVIYQILCMGIGLGASVLVSRYLGMGEREAIRKSLAIMVRFALGIAFVFCAVTFFAPRTIMCIYTTETQIINAGVTYLNWSVITYLFLGLSLTSTLILRSIGNARLPLYTSIAAFFVNVGSNYIFIFGKCGMPAMGVAGAALGTLIARIMEFCVICGYLFLVEKRIAFRPYHVLMKAGDIWGEYIRISIPVLISDAILAFGASAVTMVIGRLGEEYVVANAITSVTQQLSTVVIQGTAQAGSIITGYTLGKGDRKKAQAQGYAFLGIGILFGLFAAGLILLISRPIIHAYNVSDHTAQMAYQFMYAISIIVLFQAVNNIMTKGTLRGGGDTKMLMLTDNIFLWAVSIPLGLIAGFVFHLPAFWIYVCLKFDQIIKAFWCVFRLKSGKWIKKISA